MAAAQVPRKIAVIDVRVILGSASRQKPRQKSLCEWLAVSRRVCGVCVVVIDTSPFCNKIKILADRRRHGQMRQMVVFQAVPQLSAAPALWFNA